MTEEEKHECRHSDHRVGMIAVSQVYSRYDRLAIVLFA